MAHFYVDPQFREQVIQNFTKKIHSMTRIQNRMFRNSDPNPAKQGTDPYVHNI